MLSRAQLNISASKSKLTCHFRAPVKVRSSKDYFFYNCDIMSFNKVSDLPSPQLNNCEYSSLLGIVSDFLLKQSVFMRYLFGGSGSMELLQVLATLLVADMGLSFRKQLISLHQETTKCLCRSIIFFAL